MEVLKNIFVDQLTEKAKKKTDKVNNGYNKHLGWVFLCNNFSERPKSVRTYRSLFAANEHYTYFTPNTFYRNDQRHAGSLRWLNAIVIDIDTKNNKTNSNMSLLDVFENITIAGLPTPSLVVSTPSKGFHVYWYLKSPKRAFPKVIDHYERLQKSIAEAISGDLQAIGAERWFRMPTNNNIIFQSENRASFDELSDWLEINREEENSTYKKTVCVNAEGLLECAAIKHLLKGVPVGQRDNTCYTLALTYKASGFTCYETETFLIEWNQKNDVPMQQIEIKRKVKSAFKKGSPAGPSTFWIRQLSNMEFSYRTWEEAKPREDRTYSHLDEWKEDVLSFFKANKGSFSGSQREIAKAIKSSTDKNKSIPYTTFKKVIEHLIQTGIIEKKVEGKGRGAITYLKVIKENKIIPFSSKPKEKKSSLNINGFNSNTIIDQVVGGFSLPVALGLRRDRSLHSSLLDSRKLLHFKT